MDEQSLFDRLTLGVKRSLEKRQGICDIKLKEQVPAERHVILSWEQKYSCMMPEDMKGFYLTTNGFHLTWNIRMNDARVPIGRMEVNSIENLVRIGGASNTSGSANLISLADIEEDDDDDSETKEDGILKTPRFDHRSRIFELDPCDGFGKICLVYNNTKPGIPASNPEIWFLDRSLQWHFMTENFLSYFRLLLMHLGLPEWQYTFTDIGLSPQAKQWYHMYAPLRLDLTGNIYDAEASAKNNSNNTTLNQIDTGRVFKGKPDKKKSQTNNNNAANKKKPGGPQTIRSNPSNVGRTSSTGAAGKLGR